jgi:hypothetical protein
MKEGKADFTQLFKNMWWSGRSIMKGWGENANKLVGLMDESDHVAGMRAGQDLAKVQALTRGLNSEEKLHIFDVLDGQALPAHEKYEGISSQIREIYDSYGHDAADLGLDVYSGKDYNRALSKALAAGHDYQTATQMAMEEARAPFAMKVNYAPHYFSESAVAEYLKDGTKKDGILAAIMNRKWADDRQSAEVIMKQLLERPAEFRGGSLQHSRENLFKTGYDRDIEAVSQRYFTTAAKRLEQARRFGPRDEAAMQIINELGGESGLKAVGEKQQTASAIYSAWAGTKDPTGSALARVLTPLHSITLLSTAGIIQPAQLMNTVARIGWGNTIKSMAALTKEWVNGEGGHAAWAASTGATIDSVRADFQLNSLQDLSQFWMKMIGMEKLDRMNRYVSAVGGRFYADGLAKKMMKDGANAGQYRRLFARMGLDADAIYKKGGTLTADELRSAGLHISRDTQFASSVLDLPPMRSTPIGRFMYLFKSFSLQQSYFIKRELIDELVKYKNPAPALAYGAALVGVAPLMGESIRGLKGRRAEYPPTTMGEHLANQWENLMVVGAGGAFWDATRAIGNGPESVYRFLLGPSIGEAVQTGSVDLPALMQGNIMPLAKHIVHRTPIIGGALYNAWWPQ